MDRRNRLPSVEQVLQQHAAATLASRYGRPLTLRAVRASLAGLRQGLASGGKADTPSMTRIVEITRDTLLEWTRVGMRPVINATGVILHTNLGRAPLSSAALDAMQEAARGYSNLELELATGKRGGRGNDVQLALRILTGAEASLIVNNNAAAVLLVLSSLASRKGAAIARSQLVEIGGGFRMPDVMRQSGARLVEVGTTNRVRLSDYEDAFAKTAVVVRAHRSNFKMLGFTADPDFADIANAAHLAGQIVIDDLGSGALLDTASYGLAHEPTVQESLTAGADVICFSGDKLLGGPQAGVILGRAHLISKIAKHPLARAVRADKTTLAGLRATLTHYLLDEAADQIPVWRMLAMPIEQIAQRAETWASHLGMGTVKAGESTLGGGSLPGESLSTRVLVLPTKRPDDLLGRLRRQRPPVVARAEKGSVLMDPRTVLVEQDPLLLAGVRAAVMEA